MKQTKLKLLKGHSASADPNIRKKQMATNEPAKPNPMVKPEIPRVLMGRGGYLNNEERIKKEEAELEEMKKQARSSSRYYR